MRKEMSDRVCRSLFSPSGSMKMEGACSFDGSFLFVKFAAGAGVRLEALNGLKYFLPANVSAIGSATGKTNLFECAVLFLMKIKVRAHSSNSPKFAARIQASQSVKNSALDCLGRVGFSSSTCDVVKLPAIAAGAGERGAERRPPASAVFLC